ncbi:hypothetical protein CSIRO_2964 [Bradyrhizobiaceae bacterium SG-6C]|nr:hypothetical protein CSIRO_2964 [Bradyrhizobiaceae bacterium SG-6C]
MLIVSRKAVVIQIQIRNELRIYEFSAVLLAHTVDPGIVDTDRTACRVDRMARSSCQKKIMATLSDAANFDIASVQIEGIGNRGGGRRGRINAGACCDNRNIVKNLDRESSRPQSHGIAIAICCNDKRRQINAGRGKQVFTVISILIIQRRMVDLIFQREDIGAVDPHGQREDFAIPCTKSCAVAAFDIASESRTVGNDQNLLGLRKQSRNLSRILGDKPKGTRAIGAEINKRRQRARSTGESRAFSTIGLAIAQRIAVGIRPQQTILVHGRGDMNSGVCDRGIVIDTNEERAADGIAIGVRRGVIERQADIVLVVAGGVIQLVEQDKAELSCPLVAQRDLKYGPCVFTRSGNTDE